MTGYYDLVLGVIPLALLGAALGFNVAGFSVTTGVMIGSIASIGVIGHAMFVNGPVDDVSEVREAGEVSVAADGTGTVAPGGD